ncbi:MAG: DNA polymerase III subunit gamma/tau [Planctomycetota bacterium]
MTDATPPADPTAGPAGADYVVVARRYRPQTFGELIGQEHVARALTQAIATGRIGHAYLFTGARGVGKTSAARVFAKALNCTTADGPTPDPCNRCDVCVSVSSGDDVDVLEIDGASNRGIDEIRQLRQNAGVRPSRARMKVYIIDEVHMLTKEAFNALLKTLEEPPEHVKFIFATTEPNKIPITILSRCQRFDFAGIESASIRERLAQIAAAEGVAIEDAALQTLALRAAGSMRDSQSLLEQLLASCSGEITSADVNTLLGVAPTERVAGLAACLANRDAAAALAELDAALAGGADPGQLIDQLMAFFRDALTLCVGCGVDRLLATPPGEADSLRALADRLGVHTVMAVLQVLDQTAARLRVSVHARTLAEMAMVRVVTLGDLEEIATLAATLKQGSPLPPPAAPATPSQRAAPEPTSSAAAGRPTAPTPPQTPTPPPAPKPAAPSAPSSEQAGSGPDDEGLAKQLQARLADSASAGQPAVRKSRRQLEAEVSENSFVKKATDLFEVEPGKLRYTPPAN